LLRLTVALAVAIGVLEIIGRRGTASWSVFEHEDQTDDPDGMTVLNIGTLMPG
jgi:hypothetical protein